MLVQFTSLFILVPSLHHCLLDKDRSSVVLLEYRKMTWFSFHHKKSDSMFEETALKEIDVFNQRNLEIMKLELET